MKKLIFLFSFIFVSTNIFSQSVTYDSWTTVDIVDDFGDKTGESVSRYFSEGTFSNSATTNSEMTFKMVDYGKDEKGSGTLQIDIFEYNSTKATLAYETSRGTISCKLSDGSVVKYNAYALKSGGLAIWGKDYDSFIELINNGKGEKIKFVVNESSFSEYGNAKYVGYFHTKLD
tara:strand:- start:374 stop:895 length:522 start_codon:yes stop_codon:yes gene_type:complete